uniref:ATP-dependent DNA helicase n=1 Tax=Haemonchus contortus TaxID=6289 RepID=A0A6F7PXU0_HAECO
MPEHLEMKTDKSVDEAEYSDTEDVLDYPLEFLNQLSPSGLPPHELGLKQGCIVMLLRNLDVAKGLCNGTRLIVDQGGRFALGCRFATGSRKNQYILLPRIDNYTDNGFPFRLRRRHLPIRLAFATTINKARGQTLSRVGVYLPDDVFSHGQLYLQPEFNRSALSSR